MTEFLVRHFVKDYEAVEKSAVRTAYGVLASMVGIVCNVFLFLVKFIVGLLLHSVSVTADAFNNLSDAASSIISFIGVKMAGKLGLELARQGALVPAAALAPVYHRLSQAERERLAKVENSKGEEQHG